MKIFVRNHAVLFILVVTTTIDASRIFYLPLPKFHSEQHAVSNDKTEHQDRSPSSMFEHQKKRGEFFDWETLLDQQAVKHRINVKEVSPKHSTALTEEKLREIEESLDSTLQLNHEQEQKQQMLEEPWIADAVTGRAERLQSNPAIVTMERKKRRNDTLFLIIVGTCCVVGVVGLIAAAIFWYKIQKRAEAAADAEYPSYGVTGPNSSGGSKISPSSTMSDRKLAQSAQMFHYQQQRQQMMAQEKAHLDAKPVHSDDSEDEAPAGGDYTVYECPGLAPTGEMEVRNPLFAEPDSSLTSSAASNSNPVTNNHYPQLSTSSPTHEKSLP